MILARAAKIAGAPTVTSRFVQRIAALAGEARWHDGAHARQQLSRARARARLPGAGEIRRTSGAETETRRAAARLSVTAIEDWLRDPYTIYAKYILRLQPLDAVDTAPGARDRGTVIHGAIGDYTEMFAAKPPADPMKELLALGEKHFATLADYPEARAFWWPRFVRIAQWFAQWDGARRADVKALYAEINGELKFPVGKREFTLSAIADRIEQRQDGSYAILDYKTGAARTEKQVRTGLRPATDAGSRHFARRWFQDVRRPVRCPKSLTSR